MSADGPVEMPADLAVNVTHDDPATRFAARRTNRLALIHRSGVRTASTRLVLVATSAAAALRGTGFGATVASVREIHGQAVVASLEDVMAERVLERRKVAFGRRGFVLIRGQLLQGDAVHLRLQLEVGLDLQGFVREGLAAARALQVVEGEALALRRPAAVDRLLQTEQTAGRREYALP